MYRLARYLRDTCKRLTSHLRATFTVIYRCEHLRVTCESLACDLRVILASTCEYVRANVTSCEQPLEIPWGHYLHNKSILKTKLAYCWALKYHKTVTSEYTSRADLEIIMNNLPNPVGYRG